MCYRMKYVCTQILIYLFTLNLLHALNPSANFKDPKNLPASVCLLMRCAFSLSDQFSTDTQINHIVVCMCVRVLCKWRHCEYHGRLHYGPAHMRSRWQPTIYTVTHSVQNLSLTFRTGRVQSHMRSSVCFSTAGTSTLTVRDRQNAYEELLFTPAEVFPVSIMETECPDLKLEHDENRTSEQRKKTIVEAIV